MNELKQVGLIPNPTWRETRCRIYSINGICPTLHGIGRGGHNEPKTLLRRENETKTDIRTANSTLA